MLDDTALQRYRDDGFATGGRLLDAPALAELRERMHARIAALPPGQRPENMPSLHYGDEYFVRLFLSDPLVAVARQILGPDLALFTSYAISKPPRDGKAVAWHQDAAYFPIEPMATFTLWLAVDDSTRANGCMRVFAGTHRAKRVLEHAIDPTGDTVLPLHLPEIAQARPVDVELPAGTFSAHDPFLVHGSPPNTSAERRCGITIKYVSTRVTLDRSFVSPSGFDWKGIRLWHIGGVRGSLEYVN